MITTPRCQDLVEDFYRSMRRHREREEQLQMRSREAMTSLNSLMKSWNVVKQELWWAAERLVEVKIIIAYHGWLKRHQPTFFSSAELPISKCTLVWSQTNPRSWHIPKLMQVRMMIVWLFASLTSTIRQDLGTLPFLSSSARTVEDGCCGCGSRCWSLVFFRIKGWGFKQPWHQSQEFFGYRWVSPWYSNPKIAGTYGCSQEANSGPNLVCSASAVLSVFGGKQSEVLTGEVFHNEKSKRPNAIGGFRKWWYPKMDGLFYNYNGESY